jgi:integrase
MNHELKKINPNDSSLKETNTNIQQANPELSYFKMATSDNTRRAYQSDIRTFIAWGGVLPCTTRTVLAYLESEANRLNPRTLARHLTALKQWHHYQGLSDPTKHPLIKKTVSGIARMHGKPKEQAPALTIKSLQHWANYLDQNATLSNIRNKALLLIGFFGAFRASELVAITIEDITWEQAGIRIKLPKSKTDPTRKGQGVAIPYNENLCAIAALKAWLDESVIIKGVVFRGISKSDKIKETPLRANSLNPLLKRLAREAGIADADDISSHSLRRGLATEASRQGASMKSIMTQGRWRDTRTVLSYIEEGQSFEDNAVNALFT